MTENLSAWIRFTLADGLGAVRQRKLLTVFGLPEAVFDAGEQAVARVIGPVLARRLFAQQDPAIVQHALAWAAEAGNSIVTLGDSDYPQALLDTPDPPLLLYVKGSRALLNQPAIAIVGSRSPTPQGEENARAFAGHLADAGLTIVSGLALGIDAAAHQGALKSGASTTVAVIGTGADRVYPASNKALAHDIASNGAIISEFALGCGPLRHHFPKRNRVIAGMAAGVLVVEAAAGSGSLISARLAADMGREVFAIPGSIHSPLSRGCHQLIRDGAKLVEKAEDILVELEPVRRASIQQSSSSETSDETTLSAQEMLVLSRLGHDPIDCDTLARFCDLTVNTLSSILLTLELKGKVARIAGNRFQRLQ